MRRAAPLAALLLLAAGLAGCATGRGPTAVPDAYTLFPGTRVSIRLPPGFRHDPGIGGFASADALTAIFANEVPGSVYATVRSFSGEAFQKTGMQLVDQEKVTVDGWPGRLFRATQPVRDTELSRLVVVFGDGSVSVVLTAVGPSERWEAEAEALRDALLGARWHRDGVASSTAEAS